MSDTDNARRLADESPPRLEMLQYAVAGMADEIDSLRAELDAALAAQGQAAEARDARIKAEAERDAALGKVADICQGLTGLPRPKRAAAIRAIIEQEDTG